MYNEDGRLTVELYNPKTGKRSIEIMPPKPVFVPSENPERRRFRKGSFAAMRDIHPHLQKAGIPVSYAWQFIRDAHNVESLTELSMEQWGVVQARINALRRDKGLRLRFIAEVAAFVKTQSEPKPELDSHAIYEACGF